ncbi:Thiol-specific monooxygenase [Hypsizygus marmoreus]|uniref:Thiol-specific monooxygenase n=1 Tax=Hypsizygus marmoreus TaxID=39966 RepID=A0A369K5Q1_HYPMA|nr:Thiol-specific monooxygenase [Hypsizygus marmoreus]
MSATVHPKKVLVIGGGPAGLVSLRNLLERGQHDRVELVERRDDVGGVWYLDNPGRNSPTTQRPRWPSPAYPGLIGNVLPEFLSYSKHPFPESPRPHQPFPTLVETYDYLRQFAEPFLKNGTIRLNTEVISVQELEAGAGWKVLLRDWSEGARGKEVEEIWDGVVVANGWYDNPVWPETPGLEELRELGLAKHAQSYRGPKGYEAKRCLVIGNANSSNDMAAQLTSVATLPVYQSIRRPALPGFPRLIDERITMVAPVSKYLLHPSADSSAPKIEVHLTDGTVLQNIDTVFVGTGYKPFPSFVHVLSHQSPSTLNTVADGSDSTISTPTLAPIVSPSTNPHRVPSLHRHILYAHNPSLAFIGAPMSHTPFTLADVASTWLALAWAGGVAFPDTAEGRLEFERERLTTIEQRRAASENPSVFVSYSVLVTDEQGYAAGLREDVVSVNPELDAILPVWSNERTTLRESMWPVKLEALRYARERGYLANLEEI